jgi:hypothetical protein
VNVGVDIVAGIKPAVGVFVGVGLGVEVDVGVGLGVEVDVGVGRGVGVEVDVSVDGGVGVEVDVGVGAWAVSVAITPRATAVTVASRSGPPANLHSPLHCAPSNIRHAIAGMSNFLLSLISMALYLPYKLNWLLSPRTKSPPLALAASMYNLADSRLASFRQSRSAPSSSRDGFPIVNYTPLASYVQPPACVRSV